MAILDEIGDYKAEFRGYLEVKVHVTLYHKLTVTGSLSLPNIYSYEMLFNA